MSFFDTLNDKFFNPFCCKNRALYYGCIRQLIERSKEVPVLYEADARNVLILYLQNCTYAIEKEDIGEEISNTRTPQENASAMLRYFRDCGWISSKEIGRSGDNMASVTVLCRKLIDAIHKIFEGENKGAITNHIFSMYEILKSALEEDSVRAIRPYMNIMIPLVEHECDLKNELLLLKDSIREIMQLVMKLETVNRFGQFLIRDELLERFFNDYFFIKKSGLIPSYLSEIDRLLKAIRFSAVFDRMVQESVRIENIGASEARDKIDHQFETLFGFINFEYEQEMRVIDHQINRYYDLYASRMMMVLSGGTHLEHMVNDLLMQLKKMDAGEREKALWDLGQTHRIFNGGYIGEKSFARRRKRHPNQKNTGLVNSELTEEELKGLSEEILMEKSDRYSLEKANRHFDQLLKNRMQITVEECRIQSKKAAMMVAAAMIYSDSPGFSFKVDFQGGEIETAVARISNLIIKRKEHE